MHLEFETPIVELEDKITEMKNLAKDSGVDVDEAVKALTQIEYQIQNIPNVNWNIHRHFAPMVRPGEYGSIELHRSALGKYADYILTTAEIWAKAENCVTNGVRFKVPNITHSILLEILHSQIGHGNHQRFMLDYKGLHDMIVLTGYQKRRGRSALPMS